MKSKGRHPSERFQERVSVALTQETALTVRQPTFVVAVSGGADSMALLHALRFGSVYGNDLVVAHFDHGWREDSSDDAEEVESIADDWGLACELGEADGDAPRTEEAARSARYDFLTRVALEHDAAAVLVAHTTDDQVETVLQAILRGTGLTGLAGMPPRRQLADGVALVRPFLLAGIGRAEVRAYVDSEELSVIEDPSNADPTYQRNRIRHELLPLLRENYQPGVDAALLRLSAHATVWRKQIVQAVDRLAAEVLLPALPEGVAVPPGAEGPLCLRAGPLAEADSALVSELVRSVLVMQGWPRQNVDADQIAAVAELPQRSGRKGTLELPAGVRAQYLPKSRTAGRTEALLLFYRLGPDAT